MIKEAILTCPECGFAGPLVMPTDAYLVVHVCTGCGVTLRPKMGNCCLFCSYGNAPCPTVQTAVYGCSLKG